MNLLINRIAAEIPGNIAEWKVESIFNGSNGNIHMYKTDCALTANLYLYNLRGCSEITFPFA